MVGTGTSVGLGKRLGTRWAQARDKPHTASLASHQTCWHVSEGNDYPSKVPYTRARCHTAEALEMRWNEFFSPPTATMNTGKLITSETSVWFPLYLIQTHTTDRQTDRSDQCWISTQSRTVSFLKDLEEREVSWEELELKPSVQEQAGLTIMRHWGARQTPDKRPH